MMTENFEKAVADSKQLPRKPSNEVLLKLYALYKQATEGDRSGEPPTNAFDFVGKAKYDAWGTVAGKSAEDAMKEYIALVEELKSEA